MNLLVWEISAFCKGNLILLYQLGNLIDLACNFNFVNFFLSVNFYHSSVIKYIYKIINQLNLILMIFTRKSYELKKEISVSHIPASLNSYIHNNISILGLWQFFDWLNAFKLYEIRVVDSVQWIVCRGTYQRFVFGRKDVL